MTQELLAETGLQLNVGAFLTMLIPHTQLSPEALDDLLSDYVTRDGTADGTFTTLAERKSQLLDNLTKEQAFITFNADHMQACLVSRQEAGEEAIQAFEELKRALREQEQEAAEEDAAQREFETMFAALKEKGVFPVQLGKPTMTQEVKILLEEDRFTLAGLQDLLLRHSHGDYGLLGWSDKLSNLKAIQPQEYMLSRYQLAGKQVYVETLNGHEKTCVMLRSER